MPYLPFEQDGVVHITNGSNYGAVCGNARLGNQFESSDQTLTYALVARVQHKAITCIECLAAWVPEASSFL